MVKCKAGLCIAFLFVFHLCLLAQQKADDSLNDVIHTLFSVKSFEEAVVSPNGQEVAWVQKLVDANGVPTGASAIYVSELKPNAAPRRITAGEAGGSYDENSVAWSPDSKRLAFLSDGEKSGDRQLYVTDASGGRATRLTSAKGFLSHPGWSPDGRTIAVLFIENAARAAGPLVAETHQTGVIKEAVTEQRLAVVDAAGGPLRQLSPADMYVYEYGWSPDSKRFVTTAAHGNGDNNWYIAQIYILDAAGGEMKSIYKPPLQIANPAWSRDGKTIAWIGGLMSDEGSTGGDIFVLPAEGGEARNVTPGMKASASWLTWSANNEIIFGELVDGGAGIASVNPAGGKIQTLLRTDDHISATVSSDGKAAAMVRESYSRPPEVWAGSIGHEQQLTSANAGLKPAWGQSKSIHWKNDQFTLQGWLLYPLNFDPGKKYPLVVQVHGGPSAMARANWPTARSFSMGLPASGYFMFFPNPRGSYGQGEDFTRANVKDFGYGDFKDIMAGVDEVIKEAPVDEHRLGLTGWSYGGYMTMWGVTQTRRFAAAVAGAGLANFQSYYGENQIDQWMIPFFGASVYDDPKIYARSSPITFIKDAKTPTLVLVGDSDGECPPPQSYEFWHALKTLGVETELVVYDHEGHGFVNPDHQRDLIVRVTDWFNQYLGTQGNKSAANNANKRE